jgi:flagellar biosynthesis/type III secretory pathway protein FliH
MDEYIILSKDQVSEMLAAVDKDIELARREGYEAGRAAEAEHSTTKELEAHDHGYEYGYEHGYANGEQQGYSDGAADSYDEGYEDGHAEASLRAAEAAAFAEDVWVEGWGAHS